MRGSLSKAVDCCLMAKTSSPALGRSDARSADEPTSALDAANREQLLALFEAYRAHAAILLISHDTVCLRSLCAEIVVMEQGRISERQETSALFAAPQTDWTKRFVQAAQAQEKGGSTWKAWN